MIWPTSVAASPSAIVNVVIPLRAIRIAPPRSVRAIRFRPIDRDRVDRFVGQTVGFVEGTELRPVERGDAVHRANPDGAVRRSEQAPDQRAGIADGRAVLAHRRARPVHTRRTRLRLVECARVEAAGRALRLRAQDNHRVVRSRSRRSPARPRGGSGLSRGDRPPASHRTPRADRPSAAQRRCRPRSRDCPRGPRATARTPADAGPVDTGKRHRCNSNAAPSSPLSSIRKSPSSPPAQRVPDSIPKKAHNRPPGRSDFDAKSVR